MLRNFTGTSLTLALSCLLLMSCASEEENGVTIDRTPAAIPGDAVSITEANAVAITVELQKITKAIRAASNETTRNCANSGTVTLAWLKSTNPANGTISFASCKVGNITTTGALGFNTNFTASTVYQLASYGALSINDNGDEYRIFGIQFTENGDNLPPATFNYRRSTTFAVTLNDDIGGGVLVTTSTPIDGASNTCPTAGMLLVKGNNSSEMIITFSTGQVTIEVDNGSNGGVYDEIPGSPFDSLPNYCF